MKYNDIEFLVEILITNVFKTRFILNEVIKILYRKTTSIIYLLSII